MSHPRIFWTADRSALVEESDSRAAYLAYPSADPIPPEHLALLGKKATAVVADSSIVTVPSGAGIEPGAIAKAFSAAPKPTPKPNRRR